MTPLLLASPTPITAPWPRRLQTPFCTPASHECTRNNWKGACSHTSYKRNTTFPNTPPLPIKIVDISATIQKKLAALAEHKSQVIFLTEGLFREAALAGIDPSALPEGLASDYQAAFNWGMLASAAEVGRAAGVAYGEAYRYVRFHPLVEALLGQAA